MIDRTVKHSCYWNLFNILSSKSNHHIEWNTHVTHRTEIPISLRDCFRLFFSLPFSNLTKKSFSYDSCQLPAVPSQLACFFIFLPRTPSSFKACRNCKWHLLLPWDFLRFHFVSSEQHEKRILLEKRLALKAGFLERTTLWLLLTCCKTFAQHGLHYK